MVNFYIFSDTDIPVLKDFMERPSMRRDRIFFLSTIMLLSSASFASEFEIPNTVVRCTSSECPMIADILNANEKLTDQVIIFQTSPNHQFMERSVKQFSRGDNGGWQHININESEFVDAHPIIGFGGAFTDAASILYQNMTPELKKALINAYFSQQGLEYSLGRVPIASNDFSCRRLFHIGDKDIPVPSLIGCSKKFSAYSYADKPDVNLNNFALQPEDVYFKIPMIHDAMKAVGSNALRLFASPWSAPAWMKTNGSMIHGKLDLKNQQVWANYIVKLLEAYKQNGVYFWAITIQNEPVENAIIKWQAMYFTKEEEANYLKYFLGPIIRKYEPAYGSKIHIIMHDDQITSIKDRVSVLNDSGVAQYVDGAGLHWYTTIDLFYPDLIIAYQTLNKSAPKRKRFILGTEACEGGLTHGPIFGSWSRGESYAHDIIQDLNHHVSGWSDWNLVLDMKGGPNWADNLVDAPILVDIKKQIFYKQPMYYYLGHFSKFIRPESKLLASRSNGLFPLEEVAYQVPAHNNLPATIVVVVLNRDITDRIYFIKDDSIPTQKKYLNMSIPAHSIQTIIYRKRA